MSNIYNIKNWSNAHLKEDNNNSDELANVKHVEWKQCAKARREEEDQRKAEAEAVRKVVEEEEAKNRVSNLLPRATAS